MEMQHAFLASGCPTCAKCAHSLARSGRTDLRPIVHVEAIAADASNRNHKSAEVALNELKRVWSLTIRSVSPAGQCLSNRGGAFGVHSYMYLGIDPFSK